MRDLAPRLTGHPLTPPSRCCKPNTKNDASNNWPTCQNGGHSWLGNLLFCGVDNFQCVSPPSSPLPRPGHQLTLPLPLSSDRSASSSNACDSKYQFWWNLGGLCCKNGGSNGDAPPSDKGCPDNWYYSNKFGHCLPKNSGSNPTCTKGSSDAGSKCCKLDKRDEHGCDSGRQFWWGGSSICIDNDHDTNVQCPDKTKSCPNNYTWSFSRGHCVPKKPNDCTWQGPCVNPQHSWFPANKWCAGSGPSQHKRSPRRSSSLPFGVIDSARCPEGGVACPIGRSRSASALFECLQPDDDLESCGGCSSLGQGADCTAIAGARAVGCTAGLCEVYTCQRGFAVGHDGKSCVPSSETGSTAFLTAQARHLKRAAAALA